MPNKLLRDGLRFMFVAAGGTAGISGFVSIVLALLRPFDVLFELAVEARLDLDFELLALVDETEPLGLERFDLGYEGFRRVSPSLSEFGVLLLDFGMIGKGGKAQSCEINSGDGGPRTTGVDIFLDGGGGIGQGSLKLEEESLLGETTWEP